MMLHHIAYVKRLLESGHELEAKEYARDLGFTFREVVKNASMYIIYAEADKMVLRWEETDTVDGLDRAYYYNTFKAFKFWLVR